MKKIKHLAMLIICFAVFAVIMTGCSQVGELDKIDNSVGELQNQINSLNNTIAELQNEVNSMKAFKSYDSYDFLVEFNANHNQRVAGSTQELQAGLYIKSLLEKMGYTVHQQSFSYERKVSGVNTTFNSQNFIAKKYGTSQADKNTIVVGAHYDSVAAGHGIDDNASGVSVVLEAAQYFANNPSNFNIVFAFWGAEEVGLRGSNYFVNNLPQSQLDKILLNVNLDSLVAGDYNYIHSSSDTFARLIQSELVAYAESNNLPVKIQQGLDGETPWGEGYPATDFVPFKNKDIPYLCFESTNWEIDDFDGYSQIEDENGNYSVWHTNKDKIEWMEENLPGRIEESLKVYNSLLIQILTTFNK